MFRKMKKGVDAEKSIVDNKHMKTESIEVAVQMSMIASRQAVNDQKGNHRRTVSAGRQVPWGCG
ncbi:MAG TPA: hypothetical protein DCG51_08840 [Erysipelotrichaceae bacterium]|jgi:hypothetical protein|nr:hypothetical protein [Erysipelotrichaceae bacterium]